MGNAKQNLIGQATDEQIAEWKQQYGDIHSVTAENHVAYFKNPNRQQVGYAMGLQKDPIKMTEFLLKECRVGGSEIFEKEVSFMLGATPLLEKLVSVKQTEIAKL